MPYFCPIRAELYKIASFTFVKKPPKKGLSSTLSCYTAFTSYVDNASMAYRDKRPVYFTARLRYQNESKHADACTINGKEHELDSSHKILSAQQTMALEAKETQAVQEVLSRIGIKRLAPHLWAGDTVELCCARFLRARRYNVDKAFKLLAADVEWREKEQPKELLMQHPLDVVGLCPEDYEKYLPLWHQGFDRQGRPVAIQMYGAVRMPALLKQTTLDAIRKHHIRETEHLTQLCSEQTCRLGRVIDKWVIIVDAQGWDPYNLINTNVFRWAKVLADIDQRHSPERLANMLIINAPGVVHTFFNMISYLMDEVTKEKIQLYSRREQWLPVLAKMISPEQLPPEYGGTGVSRLSTSIARMERQPIVAEPPTPEKKTKRSGSFLQRLRLRRPISKKGLLPHFLNIIVTQLQDRLVLDPTR
eukprot:g1010.t1